MVINHIKSQIEFKSHLGSLYSNLFALYNKLPLFQLLNFPSTPLVILGAMDHLKATKKRCMQPT